MHALKSIPFLWRLCWMFGDSRSYVFFCVWLRLYAFFICEEVIVIKNDILIALIGLIGAIVGAVIGFIGTFITLRMQHKKETEVWIRDKRLNTFVDLIYILEGFYIGLDIDTYENGIIHSNEKPVQSLMTSLNEYFEVHKGELFLYLNSERYKEILVLRDKLLRFLQDEKMQTFELQKIKESEIHSILMLIKTLGIHLKQDLGIDL